MKSRDLVSKTLSSGPGRACWRVLCTGGWAFWPQWLCADSAPALANLQATGTKSPEFISVCVISEPQNKTFILRKIHHLGMWRQRENAASDACVTASCSVFMAPRCAGLSGDTGTVETLLLTKEGGVLNDGTFLCRRVISLFNGNSLLEVSWALWRAIYEKPEVSILAARRLPQERPPGMGTLPHTCHMWGHTQV